MSDMIDHLLQFCQSHKTLLAYGAGRYAQNLDEFLHLKKIRLHACVVSGEPLKGVKFMDYLPVYSVKNYPQKTEEGRYGIILSLQQRFHDDVMNNIEKYFSNNVDVFPISDDDIWTIFNYSKNFKRDRILAKQEDYSQQEESAYEERRKKILSHYNRIEVKYILLWSIGSMGWSWMYRYLRHRKAKKGVFELYYPIMWHGYDELKSVNDTLLYKLTAEGIEVLSEKNISFWRYFLRKDRNRFLFENDYRPYSTEIQKLNDFAQSYPYCKKIDFIRFSPNEEKQCATALKKIGIDGKFITFNVRDNQYTHKVKKFFFTDVAERTARYRNSNIDDFRLAIENIARNGFKVVRMGATAEKEIDWDEVIDYASKYRTEILDLYLFSRCEFFVSNMSGIQSLPQIFSKPLVGIDAALVTTRNDYLTMAPRGRDLVIFKKFWDERRSRNLSLREILEYEVNGDPNDMCTVETFGKYVRDHIVPVSNTPEEIDAVVREMVARLDGTIEYDARDEELQKEYWDIIDHYPMQNNFPFQFRVGRDFLRQNPWFLE